ncbi:hypothetical protein M011DRAFT_480200 [Sporormia fimetaria CBS 119925]|uniref:Uncharacterized protein n=1 Tax=Sporormia fimetaria CBS 119925 TaxID=1340428 RepID=A0A6A6V307_9PLEO|nr:hypothetical protein M011DRAFT_480200 [Sporormia fimetaria CBS 119925]
MNDLILDTERVFVLYIIQEGVAVVDSKYTQAFYNIGPLKATPKSSTYHDLARWTGIGLESPPCQDFGLNNPRFSIYTKSYNTTAQRAAYDVWAAAIGGANSP